MNIEYKAEDERIKVFLKIKPSLASDKIFYNVSGDKKTLSLLDNVTLDDPKKTKKIEIDKIFTQTEENSYIYEEIMRNCVKNSLNGDNFTFISYGDSTSEKHQLVIGTPDSYDNINNRGLLPRLLESYINKIDSNEILSDTISLNISYILINNNNIIDLSQLMGRENKALEKITKDELINKYSKDIKIDDNNINYLKSIKKIPIEKANDSLFFLLQILNLFYKLEATNNHFLTWSYFIIIIYVTDNNGKTVSTLSFIIMPGNEILLHRLPKRKSFLGTERRDSISLVLKKNAFEYLYATEDILEQLDAKSLIEDNDIKNNDDKNNEKIMKKEIKSKLFHIFGNIAFDINNKSIQYNRKYIIIGSIFCNSGLITHIKNTLYFLLQCHKFSEQKIKNKNKSNKEEFLDNTFFKEKIKVKNEQIYDLESKLKTQETKLNELNILMDNKDENLKALQANYKRQIELLKEELGFKGDIDNLLKEDKQSEEYAFALKIRNTIDNNKLKNIKIEELKQQINQIEKSIQQLKNLLDLKENDITMMEVVKSVRQAKTNKMMEMKKKNEMSEQIEDLKKRNKILEDKILLIKNEIKLKKNILNELPDIFNKNMKLNMYNFENKINDINNDFSLKFCGSNNEGIKKIENIEINEKNKLINKYENIEKQNKDKIKEIGNELEKMTNNFHIDKNMYLDELVKLYKSIINLILLYKKTFIVNCSIFMKKEKFDKIIFREEKYINSITFPLLYEQLGKIGYSHFQLNNKNNKTKPKIIKSKYYKNIKEEEYDNNKIYEKEKHNTIFTDKFRTNDKIHKIIEQIRNKNNEQQNDKIFPLINEVIEQKQNIFKEIVKKSNLDLLTMSKEDLQIYSKKFLENIEKIEKFVNNYIENVGTLSKFDPVQEKIIEIKKQLKNINNKINKISDKYRNNNIVFENGDKVIQRLKNENYILRKQIYEHDKKHIISTLSPTEFHHSKFKTRNYSHKNMKFNSNNYNTILTTASSIGMTGQYNFVNSARALMEQDFCATISDKMKTIDVNDDSNKNNFFKNRPTSSFSKINPYFIVSENL